MKAPSVQLLAAACSGTLSLRARPNPRWPKVSKITDLLKYHLARELAARTIASGKLRGPYGKPISNALRNRLKWQLEEGWMVAWLFWEATRAVEAAIDPQKIRQRRQSNYLESSPISGVQDSFFIDEAIRKFESALVKRWDFHLRTLTVEQVFNFLVMQTCRDHLFAANDWWKYCVSGNNADWLQSALIRRGPPFIYKLLDEDLATRRTAEDTLVAEKSNKSLWQLRMEVDTNIAFCAKRTNRHPDIYVRCSNYTRVKLGIW